MSAAPRRYTPLRLEAVPWRGGSSAVLYYRALAEPGFEPEPGVFVHFWVPGVESVPLAPVPLPEGPLGFYVRARGETTRLLVERPPVAAGMIGPMGAPYRPGRVERAVLVAGGTGLAALAPLAWRLVEQGAEVLVLHGVSTVLEAPPPRLLLPRGAEYRLATMDGSAGFRGTVVDLLESLGLGGAELVAAAGPEAMLCRLLSSTTVDKARLVLALETMVRCGMGFCGSCRVPCTGKLLCRDGVFYPAVQLRCWAEERCRPG